MSPTLTGPANTASASSSCPTTSLFRFLISTLAISPLPFLPYDVPPPPARDGPRDEMEGVRLIDSGHTKVLYSHACIAQMSRHPHSLQNAGGVSRRTDGTGSTMEHRAVRGTAAAEMMALHKSGKPTPFASSHDVDKFVPVEDVDHDLIARICAALALNPNLTHKCGWCDFGLFEMPLHWFGDTFRFHKRDVSKLHGIVAVLLFRLSLADNAGPRLNHGNGNNGSVIVQQLRHADFLTQ